MPPTKDEAFADLYALGFSPSVADALAELGVTASAASQLTSRELFGKYLAWHGIVGYTDSIIAALDNCNQVVSQRPTPAPR